MESSGQDSPTTSACFLASLAMFGNALLFWQVGLPNLATAFFGGLARGVRVFGPALRLLGVPTSILGRRWLLADAIRPWGSWPSVKGCNVVPGGTYNYGSVAGKAPAGRRTAPACFVRRLARDA